MDGVESTALWTAVARARDAARPEPVCGDVYASRFGDGLEDALVRELLAEERSTRGVPVRHRIIDDLVRREIARDPERLVLVLGAGLDTRAFRLGAGRFVELDRPKLLAWKEARLPASESPRPLKRIAIDLERESLVERVGHLRTNDPVLVVAEGLFPYLPRSTSAAIFDGLRTLFPRHELIGDVFSRRFLELYGRRGFLDILERHGIPLPRGPESARDFFESAGYRVVREISPAASSIPFARVARLFLRDLFEGSVVCQARAS